MAAIKTTAHRGYDVIGDIHGCAHTLERLLEKMGYRKRNGIYQHPSRQAIFIGDIIDRGPRIREALHLVRDMVEHGFARIVMGNHEYNALGYCTRARPGSGKKFLREHNARHDRLIKETLEQFPALIKIDPTTYNFDIPDELKSAYADAINADTAYTKAHVPPADGGCS